MFKKLAVSLIAAGGLMAATAPAHAEGRVSLSIGLGVPFGGVVGYAPAPTYYEPTPQYYGPPPAVYAPPVVYAPRPRYYAPPVVYGPAPGYYGGGYDGAYGARIGWRDGRRWHDHDGWRGQDGWRDRDGRGDRNDRHR